MVLSMILKVLKKEKLKTTICALIQKKEIEILGMLQQRAAEQS